MLQLTDISKAFVHQTVLENVNLHIRPKSRVGLIGRNGCGKSTLLRIIMGILEADSGSIYRAPGLRVSCLTQEPHITAGHTLEEEIRTVFTVVNALVSEEAALLARLEGLEGEAQLKALHRLDEVHQEMVRLDAVSIDARISRMVTGLGFSLEDLDRKVEEFSGGWQMRINLAKVLLEGADVLLLDEPTNHLDLTACEWLEMFLKEYAGGLIVVSHDRHFLDQVVKEIAEVELGSLTVWPGNYTAHLTQKEELLERQMNAVDRQQKEMAKQMAFVERFRASATKSTQAKSREKQLAKIELINAPQTNNQRMSVRFPVPQASGKQVITLRKLTKAYGENRLFEDINVDLERRERVFLLGENGCGKTTLLRLILDLEPPDMGEVRLGHNVICGYFSQNQLETLDPERSVFDTLHEAQPKMTQTEIRGLLGRFLFTGDQVFKPVSVLSGGEKSKLALAKMMLSGANTLLLDEPTNHMDIPAKEVLEGAFREYEGSILCISHDRYFIQQLATEIWEIYRGRLLKYPGNYEYYLSKREEIRALHTTSRPKSKPIAVLPEPVAPEKTNINPLKERRDIEKRLNKIEKAIIALETEIGTLQGELNNPGLQQDYQALQTLSAEIGQKQAELVTLNHEWESLAHILSESID
jgi:ATP-binding cassette, subfamily F, member 3